MAFSGCPIFSPERNSSANEDMNIRSQAVFEMCKLRGGLSVSDQCCLHV